MFEATILEAGLLKNIVDAIGKLVVEANFECSAHGISLQAMDSSHVSLINLLLRADGFESYRCDKTRSLGINMASMAKILKCADAKDTVTLKAQDSVDKLTFIFDNRKKTQEFELKLLDIDNETLGIPPTEYSFEVNISSMDFKNTCKNMQGFGDTVVISASESGVKFFTHGEIADSSVTLKPCESVDDDDNMVIEKNEDDIALTFSLNYLNFFAKASNLSHMVKLSMLRDTPMLVEYKIDTIGYIYYYLAPKIDDQ